MKIKIFIFFSTLIFLFSHDIVLGQSPNFVWAMDNGGIDESWGAGVGTDANGNVYAAGYFTDSAITFGTTTLINAGGNSETMDIYIVKYDVSGNVLWAKRAGGPNHEQVWGFSVDVSGNVFIAGLFSDPFGTIGISHPPSGNPDIFLSKYDTYGNVLWEKGVGGIDWEYEPAISVDQSGNILLIGSYSNSLTLGTTILNSTLPGKYDIFVAKFDSFGNSLWAKNIGGTDYDYAGDVSTDVNGNVFVSGYYVSPTIAFGSTILTKSAITTNFLSKYDSLGNLLWAKNVGSGDGYIWGIATDIVGNVFATGHFTDSTMIFGNDTLLRHNYNPYSGQSDFFLVKYDASGNELWAKSSGGDHNEAGNSIATDLAGNVFVVGAFSSVSVSFGTTNLTNGGNPPYSDFFIVKYDAAGNIEWATSVGGIEEEYGFGIATDNVGDIVVTGYFESNTITFGSTTLTNSGSRVTSDNFIAKLSNPVSVEEMTNDNSIRIYPNPSKGFLTIKSTTTISQIEVVNMLGEKIYSAELSSSEADIDLSYLSTGIYYIKLRTKEGFTNRQFIIAD